LAIAPIQFDLLILQAERALVTGDRATAEGAADKLQEQLGGEANNGALIAALGSIQLRLGRNTQAKENLERALELLGPNNAGLLASLVQVHLVENDAGMARARFDALRDTGAKGVEIDLLLADVLRAEGKTAEATKIYGELIAQGSRDAVGQQFGTFMQSGKRTEAAETLEAWLKDHPDDQAVTINLATLYMELGSDKALPLYEAMIDSKNPIVLNNLAWLYQQKSDPRALETARLALAAAPDSSDVLDTLGWILIGTGAAEEGVMHLRRAVQLKPNEPTVLYHLGVGLARLGSASEARITLQRALPSGEFGDREAAQQELDALSE
ncbi:MAG: hypothetical protein ACKOZX_10020, partial [Gammaproteobacteria bacterium]